MSHPDQIYVIFASTGVTCNGIRPIKIALNPNPLADVLIYAKEKPPPDPWASGFTS